MDERNDIHVDETQEPKEVERDARTVEDDLYEMISPSSAVLSSYTHDPNEEGLKTLPR